MPRPKPPHELKGRAIRMADPEWQKFKEWGGAERLRRMFGAKPERYHEVFQSTSDKIFLKRKNEEKND